MFYSFTVGFKIIFNFFRVQILHFKDMNCKGAVNIDVTVSYETCRYCMSDGIIKLLIFLYCIHMGYNYFPKYAWQSWSVSVNVKLALA